MLCPGPYYFASCTLVPREDTLTAETQQNLGASLTGTLVSSLHRLKDTNNADGAFFIFGDLSVKTEGKYRLEFNLFQMRDFAGNQTCYHIKKVTSDVFVAHSPKSFPGMAESTFLTRSFSDQGVRLRIRKEPRQLLRKRGPASEDYVPRHYKTQPKRETESHSSVRERQSRSRGSATPPTAMQPEQLPSTHLNPYNQHSSIDRRFSLQPSASALLPPITEEPPAKRPRTGSEQHQQLSYGQEQSSESSPFGGGYMLQQTQPTYPQPPYQQQGYSYVPSQAQMNLPLRDSYFTPQNLDRGDVGHPSPSMPFDPSLQRLSSQQYLPHPQVTRSYQQQMTYNAPEGMISPVQQRQTSIEGLGGGYSQHNTNSYPSPNPSMGPPSFSHVGSGPGLGVYTISPLNRQGPQSAPFRNDGSQAGSTASGTPPRSSSVMGTLPSTVDDGYPRIGLQSHTEGGYD